VYKNKDGLNLSIVFSGAENINIETNDNCLNIVVYSEKHNRNMAFTLSSSHAKKVVKDLKKFIKLAKEEFHQKSLS
jgi:hypothetical protein